MALLRESHNIWCLPAVALAAAMALWLPPCTYILVQPAIGMTDHLLTPVLEHGADTR